MSQTYYVNYPKTPDEQAGLAAQNLLGETFPRAVGGNTTGALTSGRLQVGLIGLRAGRRITNIVCEVITGGATLTLVRLGMWNSANVLVASTADVKANFTSSGVIVQSAVSTPYTVPADGGFLVGLLAVGTTCPALYQRAANSATGGRQIGTGMFAVAQQSGLADLPDPIVPVSSGLAAWFGVN